MIWLVLAACAMCLLVGLGLGVGLAHAAARGDDRTGMVDLTGHQWDPHSAGASFRVTSEIPAGSAVPMVITGGRRPNYVVDDPPKGQSAA